jgi:hypothetical protein
MTDRKKEQRRSKTEDEIRKLSRDQLNEGENAKSAGIERAMETGEQQERGKRIEKLKRQLADIDADQTSDA